MLILFVGKRQGCRWERFNKHCATHKTPNLDGGSEKRKIDVLGWQCAANRPIASALTIGASHRIFRLAVVDIYQYHSGFKKKNNQEELYNNVINVTKSDDQVIRNIAIVLCHTFKHEQDAFAVQLYNKLDKHKTDISSTNINDVENMCEHYVWFLDFANDLYADIEDGLVDKEKVKEIFWLSLSQIMHRVENGKTLFKNKIKNVWLKCCKHYKMHWHREMGNTISFMLECERKDYKMLILS